MNESKRLLSVRQFICVSGAIFFCLAFYLTLHAQSSGTGKTNEQRDASGSGLQAELIYVPIYSSIFYENGRHTLDLAATLSIYNVNPDRQVTIVRADYFNTAGKLVKKYLDRPLVLDALQTTNLFVDKSDSAGGTGANFVVDWKSKEGATSPLIEAVMVNASSNLGIAFTTAGKVVRQTPQVTK